MVALILVLALATGLFVMFRGRAATSSAIGQAYQPLRSDSTAEFTVEYVTAREGTAVVFGYLTKGSLREGYTLRLVPQKGTEKNCLCKAIAGTSRRLAQADAESTTRNIGIWLDLPPAEIKPKDRLISFDTPAAAKQITPADVPFSIAPRSSK